MILPRAEDDPGLTAPELWVNRSLLHARDSVKYGVGGLLSIHWRTRATSPQIGSAHAVAWNISLTSVDYWASWSLGQFGDPAVAAAAAAIFDSIDSFKTPRPVTWKGGPGGFTPGQCGQAGGPSYAFVATFIALRPALLAAIKTGKTATLNHLESFDYWAGSFVYGTPDRRGSTALSLATPPHHHHHHHCHPHQYPLRKLSANRATHIPHVYADVR